MYDSYNTDWSHNPVQVLRAIEVPQLWELPEKDAEAPIQRTFARLNMLKIEGKDTVIRVFLDSDHGMWPVSDENKMASGYFETITRFIKGN